jgi:3-oxoacyl-[acyl-carrier protein] reductase
MARSDLPRLEGWTVLVTGGSRGIGYATAQTFLQQGARVALCAVTADRLAAAAERLGELGPVQALVADVRDKGQVQALVERTQARFGPIDVLVNNAGRGWAGEFALQEQVSIDELVDTNVKGVLYATRAVLPQMVEHRRGIIINVSSGAGLSGFGGIATYCASKFAVVGFTEALDQEVRGRGVRVYAVCPGRVATDMQVAYSGRRIGLPPERVAERIVALAGPRPPFDTGRCLPL